MQRTLSHRKLPLVTGWRWAAVLGLGLSLVVFRASPVFAAAPPVNDDFDNATVIPATPFTGTFDTTGATAAADDPTSCGFGGPVTNTVWFSITPAVNESITLTTAGSSYFPTVSAYSGSRGALTQVACGSLPFPPVQWSATAGVTYHIMAATSFPNSGGGTLVLHVTAASAPSNDDFANATVIAATPFTSTEDTSGATSATDDPSTCGGTSHSVWYAFTPSVNETVFAQDLVAPGISISAYTGTRGSLSQVACGNGPTPATWAATAGVTYSIMVVGSNLFGGPLTLQVTASIPPPNDNFNQATVITAVPFTDNVNVSGATAAADDPTGCAGTLNSVWYSFTPAVSETFIANTSGSSYQASISVYTGAEGSLTQVACNGFSGSAPTWAGTAGVTYHLMVTNLFPFPSNQGLQLTLNLTGAVPPANDDFDHATIVSSLPFTDSIDVSGATTASDDPAGCESNASSVWYSLTPTVDETIVPDVDGSSYFATVSAYAGSRGSLTQVSCNPSTFQAKAGVTYHIMVAKVQLGPPAGQLVFHLRAIVPPVNDDIARATVISSLPFADHLDTTGATAAASDPTCFFPPSATVWYKFAAPASGSIELDSSGTYESSVAAYSGSPGSLTQVACGFGSTFPFAVAKGATYYFMVSSAGPLGGDLHFHVSALPDLPATAGCTTTVTGRVSGSVSVGSGTTCLTNATVTGAVTVRPGAQLDVTNSTIGGALTSDGAAALAVCHSAISGSLTVRSSTGLALIGDGGDGSGTCPGNTIGGSALIGGSAADANHSGVELGGNTIVGQLMVNGNVVNPASVLAVDDASVEIEGNQVGGRLGCTGNTPAPVNDGVANTVAGARSDQCQSL